MEEPHDVAHRPRRRRRVIRAAGNLLMLVGAVVLGTSIVAATRASDTWLADASRPTVPAMAHVHAGPSATRLPTLTAVPSQPAATPGPADEGATPESTPTHESNITFPRPPQPGEGLIEPVETATQTSSPYTQNVPRTRAVHISVPAVGIDADIEEVSPVEVQLGQQTVFQWPVVDWAAGHHSTSANPGEGGNIVIAGHDDVRGEVFRGLHDIKVGDQVVVSTDTKDYTYVVQEIHMRLFNTASIDEQLTIGGFIGPMPEERLTLVTCWPYKVDSHRLIVVAKPL
jgi:sortase A